MPGTATPRAATQKVATRRPAMPKAPIRKQARRKALRRRARIQRARRPSAQNRRAPTLNRRPPARPEFLLAGAERAAPLDVFRPEVLPELLTQIRPPQREI